MINEFPKAVALFTQASNSPEWWTPYKDWAAILAPLVSVGILVATLGTQLWYRRDDRLRKARSAALFVSTNFERWGQRVNRALEVWHAQYVENKSVIIDLRYLPPCPDFQHLRDLHELSLDAQILVVTTCTNLKFRQHLYEHAELSENKSVGDNTVKLIMLAHSGIHAAAAAQLIRSEYKFVAGPPETISAILAATKILDALEIEVGEDVASRLREGPGAKSA